METRQALQRRLVREGRWADATAFFARTIEELKASGFKHEAAKKNAWLKMQGEFPPLLSPQDIRQMEKIRDYQPFTEAIADEPGEEGEPAGPEEEFVEGLPLGTDDVKSDLLWAWQNIHATVKPTDAPTGSAWYLLKWGRSEKTRDKFVALVMKTFNHTAEDQDRFRDDRRRSFELLKNLRTELEGSKK